MSNINVNIPTTNHFTFTNPNGEVKKVEFKAGDAYRISYTDKKTNEVVSIYGSIYGISSFNNKPAIKIYSTIEDDTMFVIKTYGKFIVIEDISDVIPIYLEFESDKDRYKNMEYTNSITFKFDNGAMTKSRTFEYGEFVSLLINDKVKVGNKKKYYGHIQGYNEENGVITIIAYSSRGNNIKTKVVTIDPSQVLNIFRYKCIVRLDENGEKTGVVI